jgi:hypothetical protein
LNGGEGVLADIQRVPFFYVTIHCIEQESKWRQTRNLEGEKRRTRCK